MKLFKNKKTRIRNLLIIIMPFILMIGIFAYIAFSSVLNFGKTQTVYSIEAYDYHLRANATKYQKELFDELAKLCNAEEKDDLELAKSVVKNFIADFYTWSNKNGSYDVGGLYYVYSPHKMNIYSFARDTFYYYLTDYIKEYGNDDLLEVSEVTVEGSIRDEGYTTADGKNYKAFYIVADWTYKETLNFDLSKYDTRGYFIVYKNNDDRYEIVLTYGE